MASTQEKAQVVVLFSELKSIVRMQREFCHKEDQSMAQKVSGDWEHLERAWKRLTCL
jgi:hypothetical protein